MTLHKNENMDACCAVEREIDKVLLKFGSIKDHSDRTLQDLLNYIENLKTELLNGRLLCKYFVNKIFYCHCSP